MTNNKLLSLLGNYFEKRRMLIRSWKWVDVYFDPTKYPHEFRFDEFGQRFEWKFSGHCNWRKGDWDSLSYSLNAYFNRCRHYDADEHDIPFDDCVFCDASLYQGKAKIALVAMTKNGVQTLVKTVQAETSSQAELQAIQMARSAYPDLIVYNDDINTVKLFDDQNVRHIPRKLNKNADRLAAVEGSK